MVLLLDKNVPNLFRHRELLKLLALAHALTVGADRFGLVVEVEFQHVAGPALCYAAAIALGFLEFDQPFGSAELSPLLQWMLSLGLGLPSLWAALSHAVFSERVAQSIGWAPNPFQKEIAGANLGIGLGAIAASVLGPEAAWAMTVMAAGFLLGAASVHIADMVRRKNFAINNAGPIFWWDILTPLTLLILLLLRAG